MPRSPNHYVIDIDYTPEERARLKRFVAITGAGSVRQFVRLAIIEKFKNDMSRLNPLDKEYIERSL